MTLTEGKHRDSFGTFTRGKVLTINANERLNEYVSSAIFKSQGSKLYSILENIERWKDRSSRIWTVTGVFSLTLSSTKIAFVIVSWNSCSRAFRSNVNVVAKETDINVVSSKAIQRIFWRVLRFSFFFFFFSSIHLVHPVRPKAFLYLFAKCYRIRKGNGDRRIGRVTCLLELTTLFVLVLVVVTIVVAIVVVVVRKSERWLFDAKPKVIPQRKFVTVHRNYRFLLYLKLSGHPSRWRTLDETFDKKHRKFIIDPTLETEPMRGVHEA
ncbi:hypothetical protein V1478_016809 [Vespula squamosa]|uniref:Uncharacterized protein n=1 Tax=Vespula squamosa TaxID=30214 RepID=A0ABD2A1C2_VESSQ